MAQYDLDKLMKAVELLDFHCLLDLAVKNRTKKDNFTFLDAFKKATEDDWNTVICGLIKMLIKCMEEKLGSSISANWAALNKESWAEVGQVIQAAIDLAMTFFKYDLKSSTQLIQMAVLLNGIILQLPFSLDSVKNNIAHFCEKCSSTSAAVKSNFYLFNVLIYLLRRILGRKALKSDVKRVYHIRNSIRSIMVMDQVNKVEIWELFKQCAVSSLFLPMLEGQKIIALAMTLDIDKITELHRHIMAEFDSCSKKEAKMYGKIYFEAWSYCFKARRPDMLNVLEITCLQDYILLAIRNHRKAYVHPVRKLLGQFHCHKKEFEVAKMLYLLYQPLLWRYLKNPNAQVRANATQLFMDIFPLEDPDVRVVATDLELNDQLLMIKDLLSDEFPIVRVTTILGLCVQMSVNWEVFPEEMLKTYFRIFIDDLSRDSASCEVRSAVARGVKILLENPLTKQTLINILPKLSSLFHDMSENVRIAFCNVLLRVKTIAYIKYFDIVPLEELLARMEEDSHNVRKPIAKLIHNSYFPRNEDPKIWLARCLQIMKPEFASAARVFFSYAVSFIGVQSAVKFMSTGIKAIHLYVKTKHTSIQICSYLESNNKENVANGKTVVSLEEAVGFQNLHVVRSLLNCMSIMWLSLKQDVDKPENKNCLKMLVAKVGKPLADLCHHYKNTAVWDSIFYISSFLPPNIVPSLGSLCFLRLKNLPPDAQKEEYLVLLECLCNQHQAYELLKLIKSWIEVGLEDAYAPPPLKKRKTLRKSGESVYFNVPKPYLANDMMNYLFSHRGLQRSILNHDGILKEMLYFVDDVKRKFEKNSSKKMTESEGVFLRSVLFNIVRLAVFLHDERIEGGVKFVTELVQWTEKKLLKNLRVSEKKRTPFTDLINDYCLNLCKVLADVAALGFCDPDSVVHWKFFEKLLQTGYRNRYFSISAKFMCKYAACAQYEYLEQNESVMIKTMLECLPSFLECYNDEEFLKSFSPNVVKDTQLLIANAMQIVHNHVPLYIGPSSEVFKGIVKCVVGGVSDEAKRRVSELVDEPFENITLPQNSAFFFSIFNLKPKLIYIFMKSFTDFYRSEEKDMAFWISCWCFLNSIIEIKILTKPVLNETLVAINAMEKTLHEIYPKKEECAPAEKGFNGDILGKGISGEAEIFQKHCHSQFLSLKSKQYTKFCAPNKSPE